MTTSERVEDLVDRTETFDSGMAKGGLEIVLNGDWSVIATAPVAALHTCNGNQTYVVGHH